MSDDIDCTCRQSSSVRYNEGLLRFPCPVHGITFATKRERLEMLEERVSRLEARAEEERE